MTDEANDDSAADSEHAGDSKTAADADRLAYPETLRFTLATGDAAFEAALADAAAAAESGDTAGPAPEAIRAFESLADLRELLTDRRLEVLRSIHDEPPESIRALASRLDRQYAVVHDDVQTLAKHDVVYFDSGPRGAKRPFVPYETVRIDVPLIGEVDVPDSIEWRGVDANDAARSP